jgi:phospholipid/cholesterol/gamma-HCH transport system substrate-binding protein
MKNKKTRENSRWLFYSLVILSLAFLFSLWFFLHPNSPWHSRTAYKIAFEEIGNLKKGDPVSVNGLTKGYVKDFELTDSCVWAEIAVLSKVKIPVGSKFRVVNAGLMGERVIDIELGESKNYYKSGMHITGSFDIGSTTIGNLALDILNEAKDIADVLTDVADTLFSEEKIKEYKRLGQKANSFGNRASRLVNTAEKSALASIDSLVMAKDRMTGIIDSIKPNLDGVAENADELLKILVNLKESLEDIKNSISAVAEKLESDDNTISLALNKGQHGDLRLQMKKISEDAEKLMKKINKDGLDLNVDFF